MHVTTLHAMLVAALFAGVWKQQCAVSHFEQQHRLQTLWKQGVCKHADVVQMHITNTALSVPGIPVWFLTILVSRHIFP